MMSGASLELQELVADLTQQAKTMKTKMKHKKEEVEKLKSEAVEAKNSHVQAVSSMKRSNQQLSSELGNTKRKLDELQTVMRETHETQLGELVDHNNKILLQQHNLLQQLPADLKVNTNLLEDARRANQQISAKEQTKFRKELEALEFGRTAEISNIKQQYVRDINMYAWHQCGLGGSGDRPRQPPRSLRS